LSKDLTLIEPKVESTAFVRQLSVPIIRFKQTACTLKQPKGKFVAQAAQLRGSFQNDQPNKQLGSPASRPI
jgi:hypothetical protein